MPLVGKKLKAVADIVICVDISASMAPCIEALKSEINRFITDLEKPPEQGLQSVDWRMKILGFRDLNVDDEPWANLEAPLAADSAAAKAQVSSLVAQGGGDEPESALDALWHAAAKTDWRPSCTRVIVLFSDATTLDRLHPSTVSKGAVSNDTSAVAQAIVEANCAVHAWALPCKGWEDLMPLPKVVFTPLQDGGDGLGSLDFSKLMENLRKTVSKSASQGLQEGGGTVALS